MEQLRLGVFTRPVLLEVCRRTGALEAAGVAVEEVPVPSSPAQFRSLLSGELDACLTSPDNVLAYRFVPDNPLSRLVDVEVVAAVDGGLGLSLCTAPEFPEVATLRDGAVGVDVARSGFALVAYALLQAHGLAPGDYTVEALGSTPRRADALAASHVAATVLNAGNELRALRHGCHSQGGAEELGPYLGTVLARLGTTPGPVAARVGRLADVLLETARSIVSGRHSEEVVTAGQQLLGLVEEDARRHHDCLRDPVRGLCADGVVHEAAVRTLVSLRRRYLPSEGLDAVVPEMAAWVEPRALTR